MISTPTNTSPDTDSFFREYTSQDAILKYTKATAGFGISYLLDHDYKNVYLQALALLPADMKRGPLRMLEFGCGGGMNLLHLLTVLSRDNFNVEQAIGTDFSPVLVDAANKEARSYLDPQQRSRVQFCVAKNETLLEELSASLEQEPSELENSFQLIIGVNTIRYCHRARKAVGLRARHFSSARAGRSLCSDRYERSLSRFPQRLEEQASRQERAGRRVLPAVARGIHRTVSAGWF